MAEYFNAKYCVFFPYARTSFYAVLQSFDIHKGDTILLTPFNIDPMLHVLEDLRLDPNFIDINLDDFGTDYSLLESHLSKA